jgi:hypothetical protein
MNKIKNNISSSARAVSSSRQPQKNAMKREFVFPLIVGVILGGLLVMFWQFNARLNNARVAVSQLEQATAQNTKTVSDIVAFINQATGQGNQTPAAPTE